jgi:Zn-dependent protease with chaperone function
VFDPAALARVSRLVERIRALSPYPDDPVAVRLYGAPVDPGASAGLASLAAFATSDAIYLNADFLKRNPGDDEILFVAGHELAHVQRDHYAAYWGAVRRQEAVARGMAALGTREVSSNPEVEALIIKIRQHDLNYEQELEAERLGTTLALAAGARLDALRSRYARKIANETPRSAAAEQAADHPTWRRIYEEQRKIWGDLMKIP